MVHWSPMSSLACHLSNASHPHSPPSRDISNSSSDFGADFHFARIFKGDSPAIARTRHEHYLFSRLKLRARPGVQLRVLEVGCGAGSTALELAEYANVMVVGVDEDGQQVSRKLPPYFV